MNNRYRRFEVLVSILCTVLAGCDPSATSTTTAISQQPSTSPATGSTATSLLRPSASNGWIAFAADGRAGSDLGFNGFDPRIGYPGDIYVTRPGTAARRIIGFDDDGIHQYCPAFSPEGSRLAYVEAAWSDIPAGMETENQSDATSKRWAIVITDVGPAGEPRGAAQRIPLSSAEARSAPCPEWSPDGIRLAYILGSALWTSTLGEQPKTIVTDLPRPFSPMTSTDSFVWAPDGNSIAVATRTGSHRETGSSIRIVSVDGAEPTAVQEGASDEIFSALAWSPDGFAIAVTGTILTPSGGGMGADTSFVRIYPVEGFGSNRVPNNLSTTPAGLSASPGSGGPPAWSPDGSIIAFPARNEKSPFVGHEAIVLAASDGDEMVTLPREVPEAPELTLFSGVVWSPDGRNLIYIGSEENGGLGIVSVSRDPEHAPVLLTPFNRAFYSEYTNSQNLSWQPVFP